MGYHLGASAITAAGHLVMIFLMVRAVALGISMWVEQRLIDPDDHIVRATYAVLASLIFERAYYVAARFLKPLGVDLWTAHPAPEFLVLTINGALLWLLASWRAALRPPRPARRQGLIDMSVSLGVFFGVSLMFF
ncbi:MAG: hypothetical protein ACU0CO_10260 [Shimia sp.]